MITALSSGCADGVTLLSQLVEARRTTSELHLEFLKASDAANRAVLAEADDAATKAAAEARQARTVVERSVDALRPILQSLDFETELTHLAAFKARYDEYRTLDDEVLSLAVENTNVKAQRLSFGAGAEAAATFHESIQAVAQSGTAGQACCIDALVATARVGVLEIQALQAPHIAEPQDEAMSLIEAKMQASEGAARKALDRLKPLAPSASQSIASAETALDRFIAINREMIALSRRNTDVRSLALTLGRKRLIAAECDNQLQALAQELAKHQFAATR